MSLTMNETKNKILAAMPENEREDAAVTQSKSGDRWFIITDYRVIEIYMSGISPLSAIWVQEREFGRDGWEPVEILA